MEEFLDRNENKIISSESMQESLDYMDACLSDLSSYECRVTGSKNETACARAIRDKLMSKTTKTRLEAYKAYPLLGRGAFPILGGWFLLSFLLYFISFAGIGVAGVLLTLLAFITFIVGAVVLFLLYVGNKKLKTLLGSKISYNVVSEFEKNRAKNKNVIIITDNHDAPLGSYFKNFQLLQKLAFIATPVTSFVFILFCILKMALGADTVGEVVALVIIPAIIGIFGVAIMIIHYSPFDINARENNGVATSIALATYKFFVDNPELVKDNVKLVYASFGGEYSGHSGSNAFIKAHPEFSKAKVISLSDINSSDFSIVETDPLRKINYPINMVSTCKAASRELGFELKTMPHSSIKEKLSSLHGYTANEFNKVGISAISIVAKEYFKESSHIKHDDKANLFSITVSSICKLMSDYDPLHTEDTQKDVVEEKMETASGLEVLDSKGK